MILNIVHGCCMALADSVPGVSGGTVAFVLGFYEQFIESLRNLFTSDREKRKEAFFYLCKLGIGWIAGFCGSVAALSALFEKNIYFMSSLFIGLSLAAVPSIAYSEWDSIKGRYGNLLYTLLGVVIVVGMTMFRASGSGMAAVNFHTLDAGQMIYLAVSGIAAITVMVIPGISGSTLLLIMGVYLPMINALHHLMRMDFAVLPGILCIAGGILIGVIFSVRLIRAAFRRYRVQCIYLILGLVLGSLAAIIYGPMTMENPQPALDWQTFSWGGFALGVLILAALEFLPKTKNTAKSGQASGE